MPESEHPFDGVADDLFDWMNGEVEYHVEAIRGGARAPFSAAVSQKEQQNFFQRKWYKELPDGSVDYAQRNPEGRDWVLKTYGTKAYADVAAEMKALEKKSGRRPPPSEHTLEEAMKALTPQMPDVMPEDEEPV